MQRRNLRNLKPHLVGTYTGFVANEKLLRSGNKEAIRDVRQTKNIEGSIAKYVEVARKQYQRAKPKLHVGW